MSLHESSSARYGSVNDRPVEGIMKLYRYLKNYVRYLIIRIFNIESPSMMMMGQCRKDMKATITAEGITWVDK